MEDWISIETLPKYLLKALAMPVIVSVMLAIVSLITVIAVGKIWLELFQDIFFLYSPPRIFWVFNVFLKKSDKIKSFTFF